MKHQEHPIPDSKDLKDFVDSLEEEWLAEDPTLPTDAVPVVARIVRLSYYIAEKVDRNLAKFDLTRGEFEVMAVLVRNPNEKVTPKLLQSKILITSGGLSNRIRKLEEKNFLTRQHDEADRRNVILTATPLGRRVALKAVVSHMQIERSIIERLSGEEKLGLAKLLKRLILVQQHELNKDGLR